LISGVLSAVLALSTIQAAHADEAEAEACLRTKVWDGYSDGWAIRTMTSTTLANGATRNYLVTLYKGNEYEIQTCGDNAISNLDLILYDLNGNVVLRDETKDRQPKLSYKPTQTSTFYIVVHARELPDPAKSAGVAVAVTYR
jgi:hypothetical protein